MGVMLYWIAISLWLTYAWFTKRSAMAAVLVFLSGQLIFYSPCQDLFLNSQLQYFFSFFRFFRLEHPYPKNVFYDDSLIDLTNVGRKRYHNNMLEVSDYLYNNFYMNNYVKFYIWGAFFVLMPIVALIDFSMNSLTLDNIKNRKIYHNQIFSRYFFSATLMLINITIYPYALTALMEVIEG